MTVTNTTSSVTHNGNGATTEWPYTFKFPDEASVRVGVFTISTNVLTTLNSAAYEITGVGNDNGGEVTYPLPFEGDPLTTDQRLVIWRELEYEQEMEITNQSPYYPEVLEAQLDLIVMQIQQLAEEASRSIKTTLGSNLTPDEFVEDLQAGAADAAASASSAAASATAASNAQSAAETAQTAAETAQENAETAETNAEAAAATAAADAVDELGLKAGGFRNKVINGNFDIWQRGTTFTAVDAVYTADRFTSSSATDLSFSRQAFAADQTDVPGTPKYYMRITPPVAAAANTAVIRQFIEDIRTIPAGKSFTVTYYARSDVLTSLRTLVYAVYAWSSDLSTSPLAHIQSIGTNWTKVQAVGVMPSHAGKTVTDSSSILLQILTQAASWSTGYVDIAHISVVEGDATAEDDPFSPRHIQQELALCQRYYEKIDVSNALYIATAHAYSSTSAAWPLLFQPKRVAPTISIPTTVVPLTASGTVTTVVSHSVATISTVRARVLSNVSSGLVAGDASTIYANGAATITIDAEL